MKKIFTTVVTIITATTIWAAQGGTLTVAPDPIDPTQDAVFSYDGTGTNFTKWTPRCFVHAWLDPKDGETFSTGGYSTAWASCNGDAAYDALDAKVKMTHDGVEKSGKYSITINIQSFFNVASEDLSKIKNIGVIVRAQYEGEKNKTVYLLKDVSYSATPTIIVAAENANAIYCNNGSIFAEGEFRIYNIAGQDVTKLNGSLQGVYIVKALDGMHKVMVK